MGGVRWSERMSGYLSFDRLDFNQALLEGRRDGVTLALTMTLQIDDVEDFAAAEQKRARVCAGVLDSPDLGGKLQVHWGGFELLGQANGLDDHLHRRMRYRLNLTDPAGHELRFSAFKLVENDPGYDSWIDTTTLFARIYTGWWATSDVQAELTRPDPWAPHDESMALLVCTPPLATAVLALGVGDVAREVASLSGTEGGRLGQLRDVLRFGRCFATGLTTAYVGTSIADGRPSFPVDSPRAPWQSAHASEDWHAVPGREHEEPHAGRHSLQRRVVPFEVEDLSFPLNLHHIRARGADLGTRGPVLLAHGAGVRAEMFYGQPRHETIVDRLLSDGYDVWIENWRGSIDHPNNSYTLDQVARFDHPRAIETVLAQSASQTLRALVHCQGSVSFMMACVAGLLPTDEQGHPRVSDVVSNAASLFFEVPFKTWLKQRAMMPLAALVGTGADPQAGIRPFNTAGALLARVAKRTERSCGNVPCQIANYIYGSGWDVLLRHENMDEEVHAWCAGELGYTPFTLIAQIAESCRQGHIVPAPSSAAIAPASYVAKRPDVGCTRFTLLGCAQDLMFDPRGQQRACEFLTAFGVSADFVDIPGYGHMDAFWGRSAAADVFPAIGFGLEWSELERSDASLPARPSEREASRPRAAAAAGRSQHTRPVTV